MSLDSFSDLLGSSHRTSAVVSSLFHADRILDARKMSWFSSSTAPTGPNIHPVQTAFGQEALFGPLVKEDTEWLCAGGFITETQTFYATTATGGLVMCQVVHSSIG